MVTLPNVFSLPVAEVFGLPVFLCLETSLNASMGVNKVGERT